MYLQVKFYLPKMGRTDLHYLHVGRDITGGPSVVPLAAHAHGTSSEWRAYCGRETETRDSRCHAVDGSRHRHQGAGFRLLSKSGESLLMAITRRQSRLRATSAYHPASDLLRPMSAFAPITSASPPASDVGGIPAKRGVMTQTGHSSRRAAPMDHTIQTP